VKTVVTGVTLKLFLGEANQISNRKASKKKILQINKNQPK
jgi:hypothetical protein